MNDAPRQKLREIIRQHGQIIIENPRRLENLLRDYCGEFRREISVLTMALEEHAVADMLAAPASALPRKVTLARLAQRLCDNLALSEGAARWSIESWAWAFGLITDAELKANETERAVKQSEFETAKNALSTQSVAQTTRAKQNSSFNQTAQTRQTASTQTAKGTALNSVFVVSANGGGNYTSIGEALRNVPTNSRLLVREGLYHESVVLDKNIEIVGDGAVENIIVRSPNQSCVSMQTEKAAVRGLTLQGCGKSSGKSFFAVNVPHGELTLENCHVSSDSLSCVAIHGANANPLIKNCWIHDGADSGIFVFDNARALIENCDICHNKNVNLAITQGANPAVKNCRIYAGENGGIVVWGNGAAGVIEDCEITNHRLANVGISQSANPIFRRCVIFGGRDLGVFVQQKGYGSFEECDIYGNRKAEVAVTDGSNTTLRRCTIRGGSESGVYVGNLAHTLIESCNIYDNAEAGVSIYGASSANVRRCNIHRNGKVAVRVKKNSRASVEDCDLRGNRIAAWETEHGVVVEGKNNRE
ncbi:MAG: pectinesterase family protein [Pyrinomonadaceae bacterium]|nr:pectinesterase family protein [Pyrinomonadaceae bacterium]